VPVPSKLLCATLALDLGAVCFAFDTNALSEESEGEVEAEAAEAVAAEEEEVAARKMTLKKLQTLLSSIKSKIQQKQHNHNMTKRNDKYKNKTLSFCRFVVSSAVRSRVRG